MQHRIAFVGAAAAAALVLSACSGDAEPAGSAAPAASTVSVDHAQGTTEVPVSPQRVVTFDMASLDTIDALGGDVIGVPQSNLPDYLSDYADATDVGTLFEPDFEAVASLEPDLIIVANRSAEQLPQLAEIAPTIDLTLDWEDYLGSFRTNVETIGTIWDAEDEAASQLADLDATVEEIEAAAQGAGTGLVLTAAGGALTAFGPGSRFGWIHDELGITPAIADVEAATHGDPVSNEFILETDPDHLFVVDRDSATGESTVSAETLIDNEVIDRTKAAQNGNVHYLSPVPWYIVMSGLGTTEEMLDELSGALS